MPPNSTLSGSRAQMEPMRKSPPFQVRLPAIKTTHGSAEHDVHVSDEVGRGNRALSSYSSETSATTPALPLPPAPTCKARRLPLHRSTCHGAPPQQASCCSAWSVEPRQVGILRSANRLPRARHSMIPALTGSTTYLYRMRVQTGAGFSPYSNEVTVTTLQALPAAPTNLQATAFSSSQVNLTWTNNAPDATAIRVESQPLVPPALQIWVRQRHSQRTRNESPAEHDIQVSGSGAKRIGYSGYSNVATTTTLPVLKSVFLIHGLNQGPLDMRDLALNLASSYGLAPGRFRVDYGFRFQRLCRLDLSDL